MGWAIHTLEMWLPAVTSQIPLGSGWGTLFLLWLLGTINPANCCDDCLMYLQSAWCVQIVIGKTQGPGCGRAHGEELHGACGICLWERWAFLRLDVRWLGSIAGLPNATKLSTVFCFPLIILHKYKAEPIFPL